MLPPGLDGGTKAKGAPPRPESVQLPATAVAAVGPPTLHPTPKIDHGASSTAPSAPYQRRATDSDLGEAQGIAPRSPSANRADRGAETVVRETVQTEPDIQAGAGEDGLGEAAPADPSKLGELEPERREAAVVCAVGKEDESDDDEFFDAASTLGSACEAEDIDVADWEEERKREVEMEVQRERERLEEEERTLVEIEEADLSR